VSVNRNVSTPFHRANIFRYGLHGQWDYGNKWSDVDCPGGNCLRSHVNLTETLLALSMVTKSGVQANKIVVGVSSYGRSFQMTTPDCTGPLCTYTGPNSGAYGGACTGTPGYISNAELAGIAAGNATVYGNDGSGISVSPSSVSRFYDSGSDSDIMVYDSTQWVAYMSNKTKAGRTSLYKSYNFLGTADWALDLQSFNGDADNSGAAASVVTIDPTIWSIAVSQATCSAPCILVLPPYPLGSTTTLSWPILTTTLLSSGASGIKTITTTIKVPAFTLTDISLEPVTLRPTDTATYTINLEQSITPTSFIFTLPPNQATFPPTRIPTSGASVGGPPGGDGDPNQSSSSSTVVAAVFPGVTFHSTPFPITIQPQPTSSASLQKFPPPVIIQPGPPGPGCKGSHCGTRNCKTFGCPGGCGTFGCDGGCGIFGCGGGCGVHGCSSGCPLHICGGLDCVKPGSCGGVAGGGDHRDNPNEPDDSCSSKITASACTYFVSTFSTSGMNTVSTTTTSVSQSSRFVNRQANHTRRPLVRRRQCVTVRTGRSLGLRELAQPLSRLILQARLLLLPPSSVVLPTQPTSILHQSQAEASQIFHTSVSP
jgi:chitinase